MVKKATHKRYPLLPLKYIGYRQGIYAIFLLLFFLSSQGLCSYKGAWFPPTVSLSENYSACLCRCHNGDANSESSSHQLCPKALS